MSKARQLAQKPSQPTGRKNLIINGAMTVWQRGTASSAVTNAFLADRFKDIEGSDGAMTHEQSTDAPDGFAYSLELNVTTADTSLGTTQYAEIDYKVEAQDCQHFNYGSNAAQPVTLSFWVKSSKTGTYCVLFLKHDSTRYHYVKEYTIDAANTWERKTITIEPDSNIKASGGAIANDNGEGVRITWCLAMGSTYSAATDGVWSSDTNDYATSNQVNWLDSTSNNFYLTGVQLEVGSTATEFEHRSYGEELALCQRYFEVVSTGAAINFIRSGTGVAYSNAEVQTFVKFVTEKRATPTCTNTSGGQTITCTGYNTSYSSQGSFELETHGLNKTTMFLVYDQTNGNSGTLPTAVAWLRGTEDTHANAEL